MAAEFLYQLHCEGRQVITLLRSNQYEDEGSFTEVGEWLPWRSDRSGKLICEVAAARFQLARPTQPDQPLAAPAWRLGGHTGGDRDVLSLLPTVLGTGGGVLAPLFQNSREIYEHDLLDGADEFCQLR